jgi:hypothetical protein
MNFTSPSIGPTPPGGVPLPLGGRLCVISKALFEIVALLTG